MKQILDEIDFDKFISLLYLIFVCVFTFLSLTIFFKEILFKFSKLSLNLVLASFSIVGSGLLVILTIIFQIIKLYNINQKGIQFYLPKLPKLQIDEKTKKIIKQIRDLKESVQDFRGYGESNIELENERITATKMKETYISEIDFSKQVMFGLPPLGTIQRASNGLHNIQGMRIEHVTLLREVGINSVLDLSMQNSDDLYLKIISRGRPHENKSDWIPSKGMLVRWIRIAKKLI